MPGRTGKRTNPWFRMYSKFATDVDIQRMSEVDQRRWVMLLCFRCSRTDDVLPDDDVTFLLRCSNAEWNVTRNTFIEKNLISATENGVKINKWNELQFLADSSTARVRAHRDRKNGCNVSETAPDTDTDITPLTKKNNKKESFPHKIVDCPVKDLQDLYNEVICSRSDNTAVRSRGKLNKTWEAQLRARWRQGLQDISERTKLPRYTDRESGIAHWAKMFRWLLQSDFLMGRVVSNNPEAVPFRLRLDWLTKPTNFDKVISGFYHQDKRAQ